MDRDAGERNPTGEFLRFGDVQVEGSASCRKWKHKVHGSVSQQPSRRGFSAGRVVSICERPARCVALGAAQAIPQAAPYPCRGEDGGHGARAELAWEQRAAAGVEARVVSFAACITLLV